MSNIFSYKYIPIMLTMVIATMFVGVILFLINRFQEEKKREERFLEILKNATVNDYSHLSTNTKKTKRKSNFSWNHYWGVMLRETDFVSKTKSDKECGLIMILMYAFAYLLSFLITWNFGIGLIPIMMGTGFFMIIATTKMEKKQAQFENQIIGFLSSLKSNIQANETPERALMKAIDNTPSPLYEELEIAKSLTETGSFTSALNTLREKTENKTLRFLCTCIQLSSEVGANLEEQITNIEEMVEANKELDRQLDKAISENTPLLYVASALIPGLFMIMYIMNETVRDFWFKNFISWVAFFVIIGIFGIGVFFSNRVINKAKKF